MILPHFSFSVPNWLFYCLTFLFGVILGFIILIGYGYFNRDFGHTFLTPLGLNPQILANKVPSKKPLVGFLPYWTVFEADIHYHLLDYLIYFGVTLQPDGSIKTQDDHNLEIGYYRLSSGQMGTIFERAKKQDVKIGIAMIAFDNELIDTLISNPQSKNNAIQNMKMLVEQYDLDTINIDFEYNNGVDINQKPDVFADFVADVKAALVEINPEIEISVDLYANAFIHNTAYNVEMLEKVSDQLILMGYDFHRARSSNAGPVAPLKSSMHVSITKALDSAIQKEIDPNKIILAMPLYGYEWSTVTNQYNSPTYVGSGVMASYKRVQDLIIEHDIQPNWHPEAMSPWIVYERNGKTQQIYYEDDESIGYKLQLIEQANLGGGGFWALGYEGVDANLWKTVEQWRRKN